MKKVLVIINTCCRPVEIITLLDKLYENAIAGRLSITINLHNDGSFDWQTKKIKEALSILPNDERFSVNYSESPTPHEKYKYCELVTENFQKIKDTDFDYYMMIPDDALIDHNYVSNAIEMYDAIDNPNKICLNLYVEHSRKGKPCWTATPPSLCEFNGHKMWLSHWVDMEFICEKRFFKELHYKVNSPNPATWWKVNPSLGSGAGKYISTTLYTRGLAMYQVDDSLSYQKEHDSMMNFTKHASFNAVKDLRDKGSEVIVSIATMNGRQDSLKETIDSLLSNSIVPDHIYVYVNDYDEIPDFLNQNGITVELHPVGDLADNGKYSLADIEGYRFTCDDDIIYPKDYILSMISYFEANQRRYVITHHGAILATLPINHYYNDRKTFHGMKFNKKNIIVNIAGTDSVLYHTSQFKVSYDQMLSKRMCDIWFSMIVAKEGYKIMCLAHESDWLKFTEASKLFNGETIFDKHKNNCQEQTDLVNSFKWDDLDPNKQLVKPGKLFCQIANN